MNALITNAPRVPAGPNSFATLVAEPVSGWKTLAAAYHEANAAVMDQHERVFQPARDAWLAAGGIHDGSPIDRRISAALRDNEALCEISHRTLRAVCTYPVQSLAELSEKAELLNRALGFEDGDIGDVVLADLRRLVAREG